LLRQHRSHTHTARPKANIYAPRKPSRNRGTVDTSFKARRGV
jgi:hypothetical protein